MHPIQVRLLELAQTQNLAATPLRKLGEMVGVGPKPQVISHHLEQLQKKGFLQIDRKAGTTTLTSQSNQNNLVRVPILGAANCGPASAIAQENIEGYLTISTKLLDHHPDRFYALRAVGESMDDAQLPLLGGGYGQIATGDYVLVDAEDKEVRDKDVIVSDIDGVANIKRASFSNGVVTLSSQSKSKTYPPIFVDPNEASYYICGKVKKVIKFGVTK